MPLGAVVPDAMLGGCSASATTPYLNPAPLYRGAGRLRLARIAWRHRRRDGALTRAGGQRHRVTHVQLVPTHMVRLLELPAAERDRHDLSSLRCVVHAAAPCPPEVKRAFMDWVGPVVHEYYSGSEGVGFCCIGPEEWLAHPGSVGRSLGGAIHVLGPDGEELPPGEEGEVWFETTRTFEYHNDPDATAAAFDERGWSWLGDLGRADEDGYLT